uniref:Uncharacterized protein n=1 Tax=Romanomermis culicivorax TaxID=13658 RepID=A0A915ID46_ROMCU
MTSSGAGLPDDLPDEKSENRLFSDAGRRMKYEPALTRTPSWDRRQWLLAFRIGPEEEKAHNKKENN